MSTPPDSSLDQEHTPQAIASRLRATIAPSYLGDVILGAVDGTITTFAIVAGVAGAELSSSVAIVLGLANVLADGLSMAVSNYLRARADGELLQRFRDMEEAHIEEIPEGEREEIRQIFAGKGFEGPVLEQIVTVITKDRRRWVDTMLTEEWGLRLETPSPTKAALATFGAFLLAGLAPLLPLLIAPWLGLTTNQTFVASALAAATSFLVIGALRGRVVKRPLLLTGLETLLVGGIAAMAAYFVGACLKTWVAG